MISTHIASVDVHATPVYESVGGTNLDRVEGYSRRALALETSAGERLTCSTCYPSLFRGSCSYLPNSFLLAPTLETV
jgi:hypothetical protein